MKAMQKTSQLLAENQILTPESRCPRCNKKDLRSVIMTVRGDKTVNVDFTGSPEKANNLCCNECVWLNYDFKNQKLILRTNMPRRFKIGEKTQEDKDRERLDRLMADFEGHFDEHIVKGKKIKIDPSCSFCEAYDVEKNNDSSLESHQSYKKNGRTEEL